MSTSAKSKRSQVASKKTAVKKAAVKKATAKKATAKKRQPKLTLREQIMRKELEIYRAATKELSEWLAAIRRGEMQRPPKPMLS